MAKERNWILSTIYVILSTWLLKVSLADNDLWGVYTWNTSIFTTSNCSESPILIFLPQSSLLPVFKSYSFHVLYHSSRLWTAAHKSMSFFTYSNFSSGLRRKENILLEFLPTQKIYLSYCPSGLLLYWDLSLHLFSHSWNQYSM